MPPELTPESPTNASPSNATVRMALGVSYNGQATTAGKASPLATLFKTSSKRPWAALLRMQSAPCARAAPTAGVHGLMQVVHFDTPLQRAPMHRGCGAPTPFCHPTLRCNGHSPCLTAFTHAPVPRPALCLRAAAVARAPQRRVPGAWAGCFARSTAMPCGRPPTSAGRARFHLVPGLGLPGQDAGQNPAPHRDHPQPGRSAAPRTGLEPLLLALRVRSQRLFAPHDPQHHGLPDRHRPGQAASKLDAEVLAMRARAMRRRPPSRPTGCIFSARSTTRSGACPKHPCV
jgi:hypothetical protein